MIKRIIPVEEVASKPHYADIAEAFPNATYIEDEHGTWRFKRDTLVDWLLETKQVDLNRMAIDFENGSFSGDDYMQFYQGIGYSLSGFCECFPDSINDTHQEAFNDRIKRMRELKKEAK